MTIILSFQCYHPRLSQLAPSLITCNLQWLPKVLTCYLHCSMELMYNVWFLLTYSPFHACFQVWHIRRWSQMLVARDSDGWRRQHDDLVKWYDALRKEQGEDIHFCLWDQKNAMRGISHWWTADMNTAKACVVSIWEQLWLHLRKVPRKTTGCESSLHARLHDEVYRIREDPSLSNPSNIVHLWNEAWGCCCYAPAMRKSTAKVYPTSERYSMRCWDPGWWMFTVQVPPSYLAACPWSPVHQLAWSTWGGVFHGDMLHRYLYYQLDTAIWGLCHKRRWT